jgi:hypothetical protein
MSPSLVSIVTETVTFAVEGVSACCKTINVVPDVGFFSTHEKTESEETWTS